MNVMMPGYPCPVCRRAGGAVTIQRADRSPMQHYCSTECAVQHLRKPDLDPNEKQAVMAGGEAAGAYLDKIGKFDLSTLSEVEWATFCQTLFAATCAAMRKAADDEIPF